MHSIALVFRRGLIKAGVWMNTNEDKWPRPWASMAGCAEACRMRNIKGTAWGCCNMYHYCFNLFPIVICFPQTTDHNF